MSNLRISGIASGIDTETMVRDLMKAQRMKADKFGQNKQIMLWRQEQYNNVNKDFANFILDIRKELELARTTMSGTLVSNSTSNLSWVKKAGSSDDKIFTVVATAAAPAGTHRIKIEQLAEGVNLASQGPVMAGVAQATSGTKLSDLGINADSQIVFEVEVKVNGTPQTVDITVDVKQGDTISDFVKKLNNATGTASGGEVVPLGIQASFDNTTGRLFLGTKTTGEQAKIKIKAVDGDPSGLLSGVDNKFKLPLVAGTEVKGQDAMISYNGAAELKYSSNQFTINGIQINLLEKPADTSKEYTIKVDTDVNGVYNKIKAFVDKYNELIEKMNGKLGEKRNRSYLPLTSEQKESLKEDEIKKWEEKAQSGLLANDATISRTLQSMRSGLYEKVNGHDISTKYSHLTSIGIKTGDYKSKGKLEIDETKLKSAIMDDVDGVLNLLFKQYTPEAEDATLSKEALAKKTREGTGLLNRLFDDIVVGMKEIITKSGTGTNADLYRNVRSNILIDFVTGASTGKGSISFLDEDIFKIEKTIADEERRLSRIEESYWKKFTAMEKALQNMNSQSSWLAQQLGSGR